jgi:hypothetical protein
MRQMPEQQAAAWYPQAPGTQSPHRPIFSKRDRLVLLGLALIGLLAVGVPLLVCPLLLPPGTLLTGATVGGRYDAFASVYSAASVSTLTTLVYTANVRGQTVTLIAAFAEGVDYSR